MFASVPVNVIEALLVPVPVLNESPLVPERVSVPLLTLKLTCSALPSESTSLTEIALLVAVEKTSEVFSLTVCDPGTVFTGGWFTSLTVIATVLLAVCAPPPPVLPRSLVLSPGCRCRSSWRWACRSGH